MASIKRKAGFDDTLKIEDIPSRTFPLGNDIFISCSFFNKQVLIHIRRYKKCGEKYYPSTDGVTLSPFQFSILLGCEPLKTKCFRENPLVDYFIETPFISPSDPVSIISETQLSIKDEYDTKEILFQLLDDSSITIKREITCRSGRTYTRAVTVSSEQWETLLSIGDTVMCSALREKYRRVSFRQLFELVSKTSVPYQAPECASMDEVRSSLNYMVKSAFCDVIAKRNGLVNPLHTLDETLLATNTVESFNASVMDLRPYFVAEAFHEKICQFPFNPVYNQKMLSFVTRQFLNSVNVSNMIEIAREAFCKFST